MLPTFFFFANDLNFLDRFHSVGERLRLNVSVFLVLYICTRCSVAPRYSWWHALRRESHIFINVVTAAVAAEPS